MVTGLLSLLARAGGLIRSSDITGGHRQTEFIYHPGWFSLITAMVAGRGRHALAHLEQVGRARRRLHLGDDDPGGRERGRGRVLGQWHEAWQSLAQLAINLVGIVAAGLLTC